MTLEPCDVEVSTTQLFVFDFRLYTTEVLEDVLPEVAIEDRIWWHNDGVRAPGQRGTDGRSLLYMPVAGLG